MSVIKCNNKKLGLTLSYHAGMPQECWKAFKGLHTIF